MSSEPSSSRRTPVRSLRQPALLNIAIRNDAGGLEPPSHSDAVALKMAMDRKVQWRRKGERWMDKLCEGTVNTEEFKRGAKYLEHHQYLETLHERHLNGLCSYPLCPKPPAAPYSSRPRISISVARRAIEQKEGNEEDGYCSRACKVRSRFVQDQMKEGTGLRGKSWAVELLEEIRPDETQRARKVGKAAAGQGRSARDHVSSDGSASTSRPPSHANGISPPQPTLRHVSEQPSLVQDLTSPSAASKSPMKTTKRPPPKAAPPAPTYPPQPQSQLDELLAGLVIVERPTKPPTPADNPSTVSIPTPNPILQPIKAASRVSSSLIATPLKLATTLISASRLSGPVPQLAEDSDEESELSEWEMEMDGFGVQGEEEQILFDEMRKARELLDGTD